MAAESEEFERAWAQIVADLTADDRTDLAQMEQNDRRADDSAEPTGSPGEDAGYSSDPIPQSHTGEDVVAKDASAEHSSAQDPSAQDPSAQDASAQDSTHGGAVMRPDDGDPAHFLANWADEGHFTPPPPPDLPAGSPATRLGWAGTLGGVATMVLLTMTGWDVPRIVFWAAGVATLAGFVTLVWHLPDSRDDGWDDGAKL